MGYFERNFQSAPHMLSTPPKLFVCNPLSNLPFTSPPHRTNRLFSQLLHSFFDIFQFWAPACHFRQSALGRYFSCPSHQSACLVCRRGTQTQDEEPLFGISWEPYDKAWAARYTSSH